MNGKRIKQMCIFTGILVISVSGCSSRYNERIELTASEDLGSVSGNSVEYSRQMPEAESGDNILSAVESDSKAKEPDLKTTDKIIPSATREVPIYTINEATQEVESVVALVAEETILTPELIVELVIDSMADRLIDVGLESVTVDGESVIISFYHDQPPVMQVGSGTEKTILDAIAQSLVDNLKDYSSVIYRVEGKAYESGHFIFGMNQVYLDGSKTK